MAAPAIEISEVAKLYRIGAASGHWTLVDAIGQWSADLWGRMRGRAAPDEPANEFWALQDISFDVPQGQTLGLIGRNGAGKSTLLKILSKITDPTRGTIRYRGRIGSLLEVGTGFHPQLSGRDNIYLSGAVLGMSRREIQTKFDEIVDFSGIEPFIDTPVKRYSSGMYLRLAFAVAAHLDTDILLVDEVLAVGDAAFQKKCLGRMDDVSRQGKTVLFVSHNLTAVQAICERVIWIEKGRIAADGLPAASISQYLRMDGGLQSRFSRTWRRGEGPRGGCFELLEARIVPAGAQAAGGLNVHSQFDIEFVIVHAGSSENVIPHMTVVNEHDVLLWDIGPVGPLGEPRPWSTGTHKIRCTIPGDLLNDGSYRVALHLEEGDVLALSVPDVLTFQILDSSRERFGWHGDWLGAIRPRLVWTHEHADDLDGAGS